ncbi:mucin-22-like isoform X2 [Leptopilina heterotoma]|uniref:mucin-22-like isoform X2 n=1 Tax=Leptopilina heterotoma TaxID=63436 RepID=UPI001CA8E0D2|nr:mucin-22-like isoform X2 [Leptopilina heterotoma]
MCASKIIGLFVLIIFFSFRPELVKGGPVIKNLEENNKNTNNNILHENLQKRLKDHQNEKFLTLKNVIIETIEETKGNLSSNAKNEIIKIADSTFSGYNTDGSWNEEQNIINISQEIAKAVEKILSDNNNYTIVEKVGTIEFEQLLYNKIQLNKHCLASKQALKFFIVEFLLKIRNDIDIDDTHKLNASIDKIIKKYNFKRQLDKIIKDVNKIAYQMFLTIDVLNDLKYFIQNKLNKEEFLLVAVDNIMKTILIRYPNMPKLQSMLLQHYILHILLKNNFHFRGSNGINYYDISQQITEYTTINFDKIFPLDLITTNSVLDKFSMNFADFEINLLTNVSNSFKLFDKTGINFREKKNLTEMFIDFIYKYNHDFFDIKITRLQLKTWVRSFLVSPKIGEPINFYDVENKISNWILWKIGFFQLKSFLRMPVIRSLMYHNDHSGVIKAYSFDQKLETEMNSESKGTQTDDTLNKNKKTTVNEAKEQREDPSTDAGVKKEDAPSSSDPNDVETTSSVNRENESVTKTPDEKEPSLNNESSNQDATTVATNTASTETKLSSTDEGLNSTENNKKNGDSNNGLVITDHDKNSTSETTTTESTVLKTVVEKEPILNNTSSNQVVYQEPTSAVTTTTESTVLETVVEKEPTLNNTSSNQGLDQEPTNAETTTTESTILIGYRFGGGNEVNEQTTENSKQIPKKEEETATDANQSSKEENNASTNTQSKGTQTDDSLNETEKITGNEAKKQTADKSTDTEAKKENVSLSTDSNDKGTTPSVNTENESVTETPVEEKPSLNSESSKLDATTLATNTATKLAAIDDAVNSTENGKTNGDSNSGSATTDQSKNSASEPVQIESSSYKPQQEKEKEIKKDEKHPNTDSSNDSASTTTVSPNNNTPVPSVPESTTETNVKVESDLNGAPQLSSNKETNTAFTTERQEESNFEAEKADAKNNSSNVESTQTEIKKEDTLSVTHGTIIFQESDIVTTAATTVEIVDQTKDTEGATTVATNIQPPKEEVKPTTTVEANAISNNGSADNGSVVTDQNANSGSEPAQVEGGSGSTTTENTKQETPVTSDPKTPIVEKEPNLNNNSSNPVMDQVSKTEVENEPGLNNTYFNQVVDEAPTTTVSTVPKPIVKKEQTSDNTSFNQDVKEEPTNAETTTTESTVPGTVVEKEQTLNNTSSNQDVKEELTNAETTTTESTVSGTVVEKEPTMNNTSSIQVVDQEPTNAGTTTTESTVLETPVEKKPTLNNTTNQVVDQEPTISETTTTESTVPGTVLEKEPSLNDTSSNEVVKQVPTNSDSTTTEFTVPIVNRFGGGSEENKQTTENSEQIPKKEETVTDANQSSEKENNASTNTQSKGTQTDDSNGANLSNENDKSTEVEIVKEDVSSGSEPTLVVDAGVIVTTAATIVETVGQTQNTEGGTTITTSIQPANEVVDLTASEQEQLPEGNSSNVDASATKADNKQEKVPGTVVEKETTLSNTSSNQVVDKVSTNTVTTTTDSTVPETKVENEPGLDNTSFNQVVDHASATTVSTVPIVISKNEEVVTDENKNSEQGNNISTEIAVEANDIVTTAATVVNTIHQNQDTISETTVATNAQPSNQELKPTATVEANGSSTNGTPNNVSVITDQNKNSASEPIQVESSSDKLPQEAITDETKSKEIEGKQQLPEANSSNAETTTTEATVLETVVEKEPPLNNNSSNQAVDQETTNSETTTTESTVPGPIVEKVPSLNNTSFNQVVDLEPSNIGTTTTESTVLETVVEKEPTLNNTSSNQDVKEELTNAETTTTESTVLDTVVEKDQITGSSEQIPKKEEETVTVANQSSIEENNPSMNTQSKGTQTDDTVNEAKKQAADKSTDSEITDHDKNSASEPVQVESSSDKPPQEDEKHPKTDLSNDAASTTTVSPNNDTPVSSDPEFSTDTNVKVESDSNGAPQLSSNEETNASSTTERQGELISDSEKGDANNNSSTVEGTEKEISSGSKPTTPVDPVVTTAATVVEIADKSQDTEGRTTVATNIQLTNEEVNPTTSVETNGSSNNSSVLTDQNANSASEHAVTDNSSGADSSSDAASSSTVTPELETPVPVKDADNSSKTQSTQDDNKDKEEIEKKKETSATDIVQSNQNETTTVTPVKVDAAVAQESASGEAESTPNPKREESVPTVTATNPSANAPNFTTADSIINRIQTKLKEANSKQNKSGPNKDSNFIIQNIYGKEYSATVLINGTATPTSNSTKNWKYTESTIQMRQLDIKYPQTNEK